MKSIETSAVLGGALSTPSGKVALIGTYPPQKCGIATFTDDLRRAFLLADPRAQAVVCAMRGALSPLDYPREVAMTIDRDDIDAYERGALRMNAANIDIISLQHEFGIFGGPAGDCILRLLDGVRGSVVTTMHTISPHFDRDQRRVTSALLARSERIVTMAEKGREFLVRDYGADPRRVSVIPHGVPSAPAGDKEGLKASLGFAGRKVLMTFGLIGRGKGLETMIRAMPAIARAHPDALYVVLGATHPSILAAEGEAYREMLTDLAAGLGLADNVAFVNHYATFDELVDYLSAADIYVTPYPNEAQITSGTLAYAYSLGKAVLSTPYWHAAELLADGRGVLCPFGDSDAFATAANELLSNPARLAAIAARAIGESERMHWPAVGRRYLDIFAAIRRRAAIIAVPASPAVAPIGVMTPYREGLRHDANAATAARARLS